MNEMDNARQLLVYTRTFFKGSLKSDNKFFSMSAGTAIQSRKQRRNDNAPNASKIIMDLRERSTIEEILHILNTTNPAGRDGNCFEYSMVAIQYGVEVHTPNIWLASHDLHQFLVLAEDVNFSDLTLDEFRQYDSSDFWVCDPWLNIHCKMHLYGLMTVAKSTQWEHEGKELYLEPATQWSHRLFSDKIIFHKMTDHEGDPTAVWMHWKHSKPQ